MNRPRRFRKRWWVLILVVAILAISALVAPWYLRRVISAQVAAVVGGRVEIDAISLGLHWQEIQGIRILDTQPHEAWLSLKRARFELPLWEALRGRRTAGHVVLEDPRVVLQCDREGRLLTKLPEVTGEGALPFESAEIERGHFEVRQLQREPLVAKDITAEVSQHDQQLHAGIKEAQILGSQWTAQAAVDRQTGTIQGRVTAQRVPFRSQQWQRLALAPAWQPLAVDVAAEANIDSTFEFADANLVSYRLQLQLAAVEVQTSQHGALVNDGQGTLVLENGVASVSDTRATVMGGTVELVGAVDFLPDHEPTQLRARIQGIELDRLEDLWPEAAALDGGISADGDLQLRHTTAGFSIAGSIQGEVENPTARDIALNSLSFQLSLTETPIRFRQGLPQAKGSLAVQIQAQQMDVAAVLAQVRGERPSLLDTAAGQISLEGSVQVPLSTMRQPATYAASFDIQAESMTVAGQTLQRAATRATLAEGKLVCQSIAVDFSPGGHAQGKLELDLTPGGMLQVESELERIPASLVARELDEPVNRLQGELSGSILVRIPTAAWNEPRSWHATATLKSPKLELDDLACEEFAAGLRMANGQVLVSPLRVRYQAADLHGDASVSLEQPYRFAAELGLRPASLAKLLQQTPVRLPANVDGLAAGKASLAGTLQPLDWQLQGEADFSPLQLADWTSERVNLQWRLDADRLRITKATADLAGGRLEATGTIPWATDDGGTVEGTFRDFPLSQLAQSAGDIPVSLSGTVNGRFAVENIRSPTPMAIDLEFQGGQANSAGVACERLNGRAGLREGRLDLAVDGATLGGQLSVVAQGTLTQQQPRPKDLTGKVRMEGLQLGELWSALGQRQRWGDLQGLGTADLEFDLSRPGTDPWATGTIQVGNVRLAARPVTQQLTARLELSKAAWQIRDARCRLADGTLSADLRGRSSGGPAEFSVRADGVSLRPLLAFWPKASKRIAGTLDADFRGTLAQRCDGRGVLRVSRANLAGVPVSNVRIPSAWTFWPATGRGQARYDLDASLTGTGRAKAKGQIAWNRRLSLKGSGHVERLDLQKLGRAARGLNDSLTGKLSGDLVFEGRNMRSIEDLSGSFNARLIQSQTLLLPVLESLTTSLGIPSAGSITFTETEMQGNFGGGSVRMPQMRMEGPTARMWVDGRISYTGRLNFNVTADTGQLSAVNIAFGLINPTQLLRQRLIFLEITGNIDSPIVQPRTAEAIAQEVVLFFLPVASVQ